MLFERRHVWKTIGDRYRTARTRVVAETPTFARRGVSALCVTSDSLGPGSVGVCVRCCNCLTVFPYRRGRGPNETCRVLKPARIRRTVYEKVFTKGIRTDGHEGEHKRLQMTRMCSHANVQRTTKGGQDRARGGRRLECTEALTSHNICLATTNDCHAILEQSYEPTRNHVMLFKHRFLINV